ncbi:ATP-binding protein [Granulicella cerasi]|uniref:ATP-binding protein n=2 Tax=Granulicella cerasi TaxID=741063 RepID=A0ABW1Z8E6_9BACT
MNRLVALSDDRDRVVERVPGEAPVTLPTQPVASDVLHALRPLLEPLARPAQLRLTTPSRATLPAALTAEMLERMVVNLVRNSASALRRSRRLSRHIDITLTDSCGRLWLTVADNGPGMEMVTAARFAGSTEDAKPGPRGGLGHRILQELAAASGARMELTVHPGQGTIFVYSWARTDLSEQVCQVISIERKCTSC